MKDSRYLRFSAALFVLSISFAFAASVDELADALDIKGKPGIKLISFEKLVFALDSEYDYVYINPDGDYDDLWNRKTTSKKSSVGWKVQKDKVYSVSPVVGKSCLRSELPEDRKASSDAQAAILYFRVYGPGTFSFLTRTATDWGDNIQVYVDGVKSPDSPDCDGYGPDDEGFGWAYDKDLEEYPTQANIVIDEGVAPSTSIYKGTYFHDVRIVFEKDLPKYDIEWDEKKDKDIYTYVKDGPGDDDIWGTEYKAYFHNCVWLDYVTWTPLDVTLSFDNDEEEFTDSGILNINSNATNFGYMIKYTTDGSAPTRLSPDYDPNEGIAVDKTCKVKAGVFYKDVADLNNNGNTTEILQYTNSNFTVVTANVKVTASAPIIKQLSSQAGAVQVGISNAYAGNVIHYSLDGTEPNENSPVYAAPITLSDSAVIKACCTRVGVTPSAIVEMVFSKAEAPVVKPVNASGEEQLSWVTTAGSLKAKVEIPSGSTIKYGTSQSAINSTYSSPVSISTGGTLFFQAVGEGMIPSQVVAVTVYKSNKTFGIDNLGLGWNFISVPLEPTSDSIKSAFAIAKFYEYDLLHRCYVPATVLKEGKGYWVFSKDGSESFVINGAVTGTSELQQGWNCIGKALGVPVPSGIRAFSFENGKFSEVNADGIVEGKAYWVRK